MSIKIRRTAKTATLLSTAGLVGVALLSVPGPVDADSVERRMDAPLVTAGIDSVINPQEHQAVPTPPAAKPRVLLEMSQVDRIRIRVWGITDLGGEYAIDADNVLSIPRVGRIEVGKMKLAELESMLAEKLSEATRADVTVAVEVARYRPYFIMGHVAEPGAIEWRPGLKVIQAISLARGVLRPADTVEHPVTHRQSRSQLTFALAQLARLKAERDGGDVVATTERIALMVKNIPEPNRVALTNLMSRQNDMLNEQRRLLDAQVEGLSREREAATRELAATVSQEESVREQLRIARAQLTSIERLKEKNLVTNTRYLDQKSNLLQVEVRHAEMASMLERARTRLSSVELQLSTVPQQRRADLNERIDGLEREVAQLELATGIESSTDQGQEDVLQLRYHVARESEAGTETIPATLFTEILPGDVLIVSQGHQDRIGVVRDIERRAPSSSNIRDASATDTQRIIEDSALHQVRRTSDTGAQR